MRDITRRRHVDRLSALPDEVLGEIIGRLNNLEAAVRTSLLSKRWRNLWTLIPIVSFTLPDFGHKSPGRRRYVHFTTFVLDRLRGAAIRRLYFDLGYCYYKEAPRLLYRALQLNVEEVVIRTMWRRRFHWRFTEECAKIISACKSFSVLKLSFPHLPDLSGLRNLTSLELNHVSSWYSDFGEELQNCPELHTLSLKECTLRDIKISNVNLKKLTIHRCEAKNALLCAPGLLSLDLNVDCSYFDNFNVRDLPSLCSASLCIRRCNKVAMLTEILGVLGFARRVKLLEFKLKMKYTDLHLDLPTFCNLEHLEISEQLNSKLKYYLTKSLLCNAPKLESMVLIGSNMPLVKSSRYSYEHHANVKQIQFEGFVGDGIFVFELLKFVSRQAAGSKMKAVLSFDD